MFVMCIYICIYVYIHVYIHMNINIYICIHIIPYQSIVYKTDTNNLFQRTSNVKNAEGRLKGEDTVLEAEISVGMKLVSWSSAYGSC